MNEEQKKELGRRIKACRLECGMSQEELAELLNMKRTNIANYEAGRVIPPGNVILALADIFKVSTDYILGLSNTPSNKLDELDNSLVQIQRAKKNLSSQDLQKMNRMVDMIKLSFIDAFSNENKGKGDEDDNDL